MKLIDSNPYAPGGGLRLPGISRALISTARQAYTNGARNQLNDCCRQIREIPNPYEQTGQGDYAYLAFEKCRALILEG